jgi:hypothetical protein
MLDAEGCGDGADLPMLAVIEPPNLGVWLGRSVILELGSMCEVRIRTAPARDPWLNTKEAEVATREIRSNLRSA